MVLKIGFFVFFRQNTEFLISFFWVYEIWSMTQKQLWWDLHASIIIVRLNADIEMSRDTDLSEELLQQWGGPAVVHVPVFGRVADVSRVQYQG